MESVVTVAVMTSGQYVYELALTVPKFIVYVAGVIVGVVFPDPPLIVQVTLLTVTPTPAESAINIWLSLNQFGVVAVEPLITVGQLYVLLIFSGASAVNVTSSVRAAIRARPDR